MSREVDRGQKQIALHRVNTLMRRHSLNAVFCALLLCVNSDSVSGRFQSGDLFPKDLNDPRLNRLRVASEVWSERELGRSRRVVLDQVCLVPDLPTFFEAIASWDEKQYWPILIEDVPHTLRFLRAFRPSRVVRFPRKGSTSHRWEAAETAVGRAWTDLDEKGSRDSAGLDLIKAPGVVFSAPDSPNLGGAVALSAGRFQRLVRLDFPKKFSDTLDAQGLNDFALQVEAGIRATSKKYDALGDDCDFITLAGDWPYRYNAKDGLRCVDDLVGRSAKTLGRWAFVGRLSMDEKKSVYESMCSLFLSTESATLFNSYPEVGEPWAGYRMSVAAEILSKRLSVNRFSGEKRTSLDGWHQAFDPRNLSELVLINSKGGPTNFDLPGGGATTLDVPQTAPTAVAMIHSFSAAEPANASTIAGRWLANGAFVYHGSMFEPFLQSFRPPSLVAALVASGLPLGAALRQLETEPFGHPWRLIFIGDPLYRVTPRGEARPRSGEFGRSESWPLYRVGNKPGVDTNASDRLSWALQASITATTRGGGQRPLAEILETLMLIDRDELDPTLRPLLDLLLADQLFLAGKYHDLRAKVAAIPLDRRPESASLLADSSVVIELNRLPETAFDKALEIWSDCFRLELGTPVRTYATAHVLKRATGPLRLQQFRGRLRPVLERVKGTESEELIRSTLQGVEKTLGPAR